MCAAVQDPPGTGRGSQRSAEAELGVDARALPRVPGVSHRVVQLQESVRLHLAEAGVGPPLGLLHGWPQHWWGWRRLIPERARDHHVLVPDLGGLGWSKAPPGN